MEQIHHLLVVGAGIMGHGFAQVFALHGFSVSLVDQTQEILSRARDWIQESLNTMVEIGGQIGSSDVQATLDRIQFFTDLGAPAKDAHYVIEAVTEDLDLKKDIFYQLDGFTSPDTILASNTSSFDINELAKGTRYPERIIGTHWFHPPQITPCVEVIPGDATDQKTIETTFFLMEKIGKYPTRCKSAPGFVANRIQFAMATEAISLVEEGLATPHEVDRIVKSSFGFRLGAYGPFEIMDQAGIDTYLGVYKYLYDKLGREHFKPPKLLIRQVKNKRLGIKTSGGFYDYGPGAATRVRRERDGKLYARLNLFRSELQESD